MITAQSALMSDLVEVDPHYQNSFLSNEKTLLKNHQIEKLSDYFSYPADDLLDCYLKKTGKELISKSKDPKTIFKNSHEKSVEEILENLIFISNDGTDLAKPYARKMPGREKIRDGSASSKKRCVVNYGYNIEGSIAVKNKKISPLLMNLYSSKEEEKYKEHGFAERENLRTLQKYDLIKNSVYLYDRAGDDERKLFYLKNNRVKFVVRAKIKRNIADPKDLELIKCARTAKERDKYFKPLKKVIEEMEFHKHHEFGKKDVAFKRVLISRTLYKDGKYCQRYFPLTLVVIKFPKGTYLDEDEAEEDKESTIMLYTSLPVQNTKEAFCILEMYKIRWYVEVYFRFLKQTFLIEKVQVLNYWKIKNLMKYVVMASAWHHQKFYQFVEDTDPPPKKRRTFEEIEKAEIRTGYRSYLKFKNYSENVSNFASFIRTLFQAKIRYEVFARAP